MPNLTSNLIAAAVALAISACVVSAQTTTPTTPKAAPASPAPKKGPATKKPTTPAGIKCSADADAKGLHGKERRKFRSACIREFKKAERAKKA